MGIRDALLTVSDSQVTGAAAVSTNSVDLGAGTPKRRIGTGEAVGFEVSVEVAPTGVSLQIEVITATDAALTTGIVAQASRTILAADAPVGSQHYIQVPPGGPLGTARYLGLRYTVPAGTSTVTASLIPADYFAATPEYYPKGYTA